MIHAFSAALWLTAMPTPVELTEPLSRVDATRLLAACVLKRDRPNAVVIASMDASTPEFNKAARGIRSAASVCLGHKMRSLTIRVNDLRGAFAESLLKETDGAALARALALPSLPPQRINPSKDEDMNDAALFRCVVGAAPAQAVALVEALPGSIEEGAAFRSLGSALQSCVPEKSAMHIKPFQVRLLVAASLFGRLAVPSGT